MDDINLCAMTKNQYAKRYAHSILFHQSGKDSTIEFVGKCPDHCHPLAQEVLAVLMDLDPAEKPNIRANEKGAGYAALVVLWYMNRKHSRCPEKSLCIQAQR